MKNYILYAFLACGMLSSCYDDKGNYDYEEINRVEISGINENQPYTKIAFVDTLRLEPTIQSTLDPKNEYEYEWKLIPAGIDFKDVEEGEDFIVSKENKLEMPITLKAGRYDGYYIVKDKNTGVDWMKKFSLLVKTLTGEGWLVLCDDEGDSRMDIIFNVDKENDIVAKNTWENKTFQTGKPEKIMYNYNLHRTRTLLVSEKGTFDLDKQDLHVGEDNNLRWSFGVTPDAIYVKASGMSQFADKNYWVVVDELGDAYALSLSTYGGIFEFPINKLNGKEEFVAAPFVGVTYGWFYGCSPILMYDQTNKQFLEIRNSASYPSPMRFSGTNLFPCQTGNDFVYGESSKDGTNWVVLKNSETNQHYFYGIVMNAEEKNEQKYYGEIKGAGIADATLFACHHIFPYLFYVSHNKVYQFDMQHPETPAKEILSYPGEEIKEIKFTPFVAWEPYENWERERNYQLLVGTTDTQKDKDHCGIIRMYEVPNLMEPLVKVKEYSGLGNIVSVTYKERSAN